MFLQPVLMFLYNCVVCACIYVSPHEVYHDIESDKNQIFFVLPVTLHLNNTRSNGLLRLSPEKGINFNLCMKTKETEIDCF